MSTSVGTITIEMAANVAKLMADMDSAKKAVGGAVGEMQKAADFAKKAFIGLTGVASVGAFVGMITGAIDAAESLHDLAIQTGVSVETLSALSEMGKKTDTSATEIAGAMNKLAKNMAVANEESKGTGQALKALGINFDDFQKMNPDDQMLLVAKSMAQFSDGSGKSAVAMTLFGKEGAKLLPFFADLAAAGKLNATVTTEQAALADEYNDRLTELKAVGEGWIRTLALEALPALLKLAEFTGGAVKITGAYIGLVIVLPKVLTAANGAIWQFITAGTGATTTTMGLSASISALVTQIGLLKLATNTLFAAFAGWQIGKWLRENFLEAQLAGIAFVEGTMVGWQTIKFAAEGAWLAIKNMVFFTIDGITGKFSDMVAAIGRGLQAIGKEDAGAVMLAFAERTREATKSGFDMRTEMARLTAEYNSNVKGVRAITGDMADYAIQSFKTTKSVEKHREQLKFQAADAKKSAKAIKEDKEALDLLKDTQDAEIAVLKALKKEHEDAVEVVTKETIAIRDQIEKQRDANDAMRYTSEQLATLEIQKLNDAAATAARNALLVDETLINGDIAAQYRLQAEGLKELAALKAEGIHLKAAQESAAEWQKTSDSIFNSMTDALFRAFESGKGFGKALADTLKNTFKTLVLQPTIQALMAPVAGILGSIFGGSAAAGTGGGMGIGGGLTALKAALGTNSLMAWGGGLAGGYGFGNMISGQYGGKGTVIAGTALGAAVGGPLGALVGGMVGGVVNRLFGRGPKKITEKGIVGDVLGGDFDGQLYADWKKKGGLLRKSKRGTDYSQVDAELAETMNAAGAAVFSGVSDYAKILGLPADALATVNHHLKVKLTDDEEENQRLLEEAFEGYEDALAGTFGDALKPFQEAGEDISDTLQRMSGLQVFSETMNEFGGIFARVASLGVRAKEELIGFAGGIEALIAKTASFVENYYSDAEKFGIGARQIQDALAAIGITSDISSRADLRTLIEGLDISTSEGRKQLDALLTIAQAFAPIGQYLEQNGGTLGALADSAPQTALLQSVLDDSEIQTEYQQRTADGVDKLSNDMLSVGERISAAIAAGNTDIIAALVAIATTSAQTARLLDRWDGGDAMTTTPAT